LKNGGIKMNLCSDGHDEVCYECRFCPACSLREDFEQQIKDLNNELIQERQYIAHLEKEKNE
jgi:hypothetical protein